MSDQPPPPSASGPPPGDESWRGSEPPTGPDWQWSPPPHPSGLPNDVRNWAMGAHLSAFLAAWLAGLSLLGPLVVWLLKREENHFIADHAREALNFNISMLIYVAVSAVLIFVLIGIPLLLGLLVAWIVLVVVAAVRASNGKPYRYPITIRFVR